MLYGNRPVGIFKNIQVPRCAFVFHSFFQRPQWSNAIKQRVLQSFLFRIPYFDRFPVVISCKDKLNLEYLKDSIWDKLNMIRVFTKKPGEKPNLADEEGIILRNGASVEHCCHAVHRSIKEQFKYALVWGTSAKYSPQRVGLTHCLHHDDVLQIIKKQEKILEFLYLKKEKCSKASKLISRRWQ